MRKIVSISQLQPYIARRWSTASWTPAEIPLQSRFSECQTQQRTTHKQTAWWTGQGVLFCGQSIRNQLPAPDISRRIAALSTNGGEFDKRLYSSRTVSDRLDRRNGNHAQYHKQNHQAESGEQTRWLNSLLSLRYRKSPCRHRKREFSGSFGKCGVWVIFFAM